MIGDFYAPRFDIRIAGLTLAADVTAQVLRVSCDNNLDVADMFTVVLRNADNRLLDSALFDLGKTVEIHMGYGNDLHPIMLGEIASIEPSFPESGPPTVKITGYDKSYKMRHNQPDRPAFRYVTDSVIAAQIALENGLIPVVDPSPIFHRHALAQTGSDMGFLSARAEANFFDVYVYWDKLYFQFPRPQTEAIVLEWGKNLSNFEPRISSASLAGLQVIRGYNEELAETIVAFAVAADLNVDNIVEKLGSSALELLLSMGRRLVKDKKVSTPLDAALLAKSILRNILEGLYEGTGSCIGIPALRAGKFVGIRGVGKRFSGKYRLRKVTHTISAAGYHTSFEIMQRESGTLLALARKYLARKKEFKVTGVAVARVIANAEILAVPPEVPLGRVKLSFPWLSDKIETGWVRCAMPMAGKNSGLFFLPDVGDEVLVAFENGDVSRPVVIGSLWNGQQLPPETNQGLNVTRVIKTKAGHQIKFDDTLGLESVVVQHKNGSEVRMEFNGSVTVSARTDLTLKATGSITLEAMKVDVKVASAMNVL